MRAVGSGLCGGPLPYGNVFGGLMVYISEALLNQADSKSIKLFEVIARVEFSSRPIVSQPREVTAYRVHIFLALLFWIGVVKSEIDQAIVLVCKSKGEANGLGVSNVQISIGFRWEAGVDLPVLAIFEVVLDDLLYKVNRF
mgnify:CR=1 FL=1